MDGGSGSAKSMPKEWIRGDTKIDPVMEVRVTHELYQYVIEIGVRSLKNDGSQSWIVICRVMKPVCERTVRRTWIICLLRRDDYRYGETLCDKTEGTIKSIITFIFKDVSAD